MHDPKKWAGLKWSEHTSLQTNPGREDLCLVIGFNTLLSVSNKKTLCPGSPATKICYPYKSSCDLY